MFKLVLFVIAIIVGYVLFTHHEQKKVAEQKEQREQQIMVKQKQFMDQTKDMGQQLQQDVQQRMESADANNQ